MKKFNIELSIVLIMIFITSMLLSSCATPPTPSSTTSPTTTTSSAKPQDLKPLSISHMFPVGSAYDQHITKWAKKVEADSNGRITFKMFPGASLTSPMENYAATASGACDVLMGFRYESQGTDVGRTLGFFLIGAPDVEVAIKIQDELWDKFKDWKAEWDKVKVLYMSCSTPARISASKPIRTLENLKGLQIRTSSGTYGGFLMKELGATPVDMPFTEAYSALEKHIVDGIATASETLKSYKIAEVTKYTTLVNLWYGQGFAVIMNKDTYNKLTPDLQSIIDKDAEWAKSDILQMWKTFDDPAIEYAKSLGHEFITVSPEEMKKWMDKISVAQSTLASDLDKKGFQGTEILKFIKERMKFYSK